MGWTGLSQYEYDTTKVSGLKAFFQNRFFIVGLTIVECSAKGNVCYCAVKNGDNDVSCYIFKYSNAVTMDGCNFAYKAIHENDGAYCYEPSQKVLNALSDTDNEYALRWREKCKELKAKSKIKFEVGDIIQFDNEITFTSGHSDNIFILASDGKNFTYYDRDRDYSKWTKNDLIPRYRISKWKTKEFKIIGNVLKKF